MLEFNDLLLTFPQWEGTESLEELKQKLFKFWEDRHRKLKKQSFALRIMDLKKKKRSKVMHKVKIRETHSHVF